MLADYLASLRNTRFQPGVLDCGIFLADWAMRCGLSDPIADLRGAYANEKGYLRIIRREGGFVECCSRRLARIGMVETTQARSGDLAIVLAPYAARRGSIQRRPTGAVVVDDVRRAVVTSDIGLVIALEKDLPVMKAWTFAKLEVDSWRP